MNDADRATSDGAARMVRPGAMQVPAELTLRIRVDGLADQPKWQVAPTNLEAGALAIEAAQQPIINTDYGDRTGFDEDFIGIRTPLLTVTAEDAVAPLLDGSGYVLHYEHFSVVMHAERRLALYAASNVNFSPAAKRPAPGNYTRDGLNGFGPNVRGEVWLLDRRIDADHQLDNTFYDRDDGAFDKGHVCRRDDVCFGSSYAQIRQANGDTFHSTNCTPQRKNFNQAGAAGVWGQLEEFIGDQADTELLNIFAGPVLAAGDRVFEGRDRQGPIRVQIPKRFWKVVCANAGGELQVFAFLLEQRVSDVTAPEFAVTDPWRRRMVSLVELERLIPLIKFDPALHVADQRRGSESAKAAMRLVSSVRKVHAMPNVKSIERPQGAVAPLESESAVPPTITLPANQGSVDGPLSRVAASRLVVGKAPALGALPIESIIGIDDRVRIFDTDLAPWRMICSLQMTAPFGSFIGTGWFVGPKTIITAGHCVYHREFMGGWATKIIAIPGRDDSREPFGRVESTRLLTNDRWESDQDPDFDIGCIQLDTPLGDQTGWFGVLSTDDAALQRFLINVAGYPGDPEVGRNGRFLLHDRRMITAVTSRRIFYNADSTAGESGGPAWIYETPDGPPLAVGVHAYGIGGTPSNLNITANSAPRIIPEVAELIRGWIQANP